MTVSVSSEIYSNAVCANLLKDCTKSLSLGSGTKKKGVFIFIHW